MLIFHKKKKKNPLPLTFTFQHYFLRTLKHSINLYFPLAYNKHSHHLSAIGALFIGTADIVQQ